MRTIYVFMLCHKNGANNHKGRQADGRSLVTQRPPIAPTETLRVAPPHTFTQSGAPHTNCDGPAPQYRSGRFPPSPAEWRLQGRAISWSPYLRANCGGRERRTPKQQRQSAASEPMTPKSHPLTAGCHPRSGMLTPAVFSLALNICFELVLTLSVEGLCPHLDRDAEGVDERVVEVLQGCRCALLRFEANEAHLT